jgi:NADPH:quinone reductase-like Zn-dependent oxidoreductase
MHGMCFSTPHTELVSKGSSVPSKYETGKRYGRGWFGGCCFACEACRRGDFILCQTHWVSGISDDGGYAEYMLCPWESLTAIPDNLSSEVAAPLLCAGVTVFNSLRNAGAVPPATVAVYVFNSRLSLSSDVIHAACLTKCGNRVLTYFIHVLYIHMRMHQTTMPTELD